MFLFPKKARFTKSFSGNRLVIKNPKISYNIKNKYSGISLIATESGKVTNFQMEAVRRFLRRFLKKKAQLFFRVFPNVPITKKPNDVRQGRGKGNVKY
jgi:large subunit ribosomal protein L16